MSGSNGSGDGLGGGGFGPEPPLVILESAALSDLTKRVEALEQQVVELKYQIDHGGLTYPIGTYAAPGDPGHDNDPSPHPEFPLAYANLVPPDLHIAEATAIFHAKPGDTLNVGNPQAAALFAKTISKLGLAFCTMDGLAWTPPDPAVSPEVLEGDEVASTPDPVRGGASAKPREKPAAE